MNNLPSFKIEAWLPSLNHDNRHHNRPIVYLDETWANAHNGEDCAWVVRDDLGDDAFYTLKAHDFSSMYTTTFGSDFLQCTMDVLLVEDKELVLDADKHLPALSLQTHFETSVTGLYYIWEEGKEQYKYTMIYISAHNHFLVDLLVTNEIVMKPKGGCPAAE